MGIDAILFDLDGTLVDSAPLIGDVLNEMREEWGRLPLPVTRIRKWISLGASQLVAQALEVQPAEAPPLVQEFRNRYGLAPTPVESLYPGALETVSALAASNVQLGICSNKPARLCDKVLAETGLRPYFGVVVGGDSVTHPKPHRQPVDHALQILGARRATAIYVGDSAIDQAAAGSAGLPFVFFTAGYDDGVDGQAAWARIEHLLQLLEIVTKRGGAEFL